MEAANETSTSNLKISCARKQKKLKLYKSYKDSGCRQNNEHQGRLATFTLQAMPGEVGGQKESLLKRAERTKSICNILVGKDTPQFILR